MADYLVISLVYSVCTNTHIMDLLQRELPEIWQMRNHLCRKRCKIMPWLLLNVNRKSYAIYRMLSLSVTLSGSGFRVAEFCKIK